MVTTVAHRAQFDICRRLPLTYHVCVWLCVLWIAFVAPWWCIAHCSGTHSDVTYGEFRGYVCGSIAELSHNPVSATIKTLPLPVLLACEFIADSLHIRTVPTLYHYLLLAFISYLSPPRTPPPRGISTTLFAH